MLRVFKVHIIHVGNMANKGTQALLISDVSVIREIVGNDVSISVSTVDIEGVKRLNLPLDAITSPLLDIPYEKADFYARKYGFNRKSFKYKMLALASFFLMVIQLLLSAFSILLSKVGLKPLYKADAVKCMKECDLVISYSDENFKETASMLPLNIYWVLAWWSMLASRTWEIVAAKLLNKPVVMFPNSVGPFRTFIGRLFAKIALNSCHTILIREPISYGVVNSLGVKAQKILTSDTSILFGALAKTNYIKPSTVMIGVSPGIYTFSLPREMIQNYILSHARALDEAIERYGFSVVFLPHYITGFTLDDFEVSKLIARNMKNREKTRIINARSVEEFKHWIAQMKIVVSSKMHPAVIAASVHVPFLFIAYDYKQTGFASSLGLDDCVLSIRDFSYDKLLAKIEYIWKNLDVIQKLLRKRVPDLQKNVKDSVAFALAPFIDVK